mgnify:CR=1 FL=1
MIENNPESPPRILLGPGPSMANPRVLKAMSHSMLGYLDPDFMIVLDEISDLIARLYKTDNLSMAIPGTGSAGMEAGFTSLLEPNDKVIMCAYGHFCERMIEMATRVGANVVPIRAQWGEPFPEELLEKELKKHPDVKLVTAIHAETSTGVCQPLEDISKLTKQYGAMLMVDAVTSLGGTDLDVDKLSIDYVYSATQKCLGAPPGLSPVAISDEAMATIKSRKTKPFSWYLDLSLIADYWNEKRIYHHTTPVSMMFGLREALTIIFEEGLENRFNRHKENADILRSGLEAMKFDLLGSGISRLNQITPVVIPTGVDGNQVVDQLLREFNIEIGKGLGEFAGKIWRIGLMGESSQAEYVFAFLSALESVLIHQEVQL